MYCVVVSVRAFVCVCLCGGVWKKPLPLANSLFKSTNFPSVYLRSKCRLSLKTGVS